MKAVNTSTPKVYSRNDPKSPISQAILDLIKEKRRLRRLYNNTQDLNIKSTINRLQKEIMTKINQESTISWEKFCNSISLESRSWRKITNFLKPKGPRSYPTLKLGNKTAKTNPEKAQLFAESVERNFGIESHLFRKSHFDRINKLVEAHSYHFTPLDSIHDSITDTDDDSDFVADVDPDTLIRIVRTELKNGKAPGIDNVCNIILKKGIGTGFYKILTYKIYQLDLPTKLCKWLSDFLVGRVIQVKIEGFLSPKFYPKAGVPQGSNLSHYFSLSMSMTCQIQVTTRLNKSQFADDADQWAVSKNIDLAAEYLQRDLDKLARWCAKWRIKLNPDKAKVIIFSKSQTAIRAEPALCLYTTTSFRIILT